MSDIAVKPLRSRTTGRMIDKKEGASIVGDSFFSRTEKLLARC
ncbi:MAG: hypothetical protein OEX80_07070 [Candidatus Aminicenantes bacterium]|nr:hypothetical protein [Candidatus Aminicenantes bacterium]